MAYCTEAQVEALLAITIATTAGTDGKTLVLTADQLTAQIANADAYIDSKLVAVSGLSLPLATVPTAVMECSRMIAGANALKSAGLPAFTDGGENASDFYLKRADEMLTALVANPALLIGSSTAARWGYDTTLAEELVDFEAEAKAYVENR